MKYMVLLFLLNLCGIQDKEVVMADKKYDVLKPFKYTCTGIENMKLEFENGTSGSLDIGIELYEDGTYYILYYPYSEGTSVEIVYRLSVGCFSIKKDIII